MYLCSACYLNIHSYGYPAFNLYILICDSFCLTGNVVIMQIDEKFSKILRFLEKNQYIISHEELYENDAAIIYVKPKLHIFDDGLMIFCRGRCFE